MTMQIIVAALATALVLILMHYWIPDRFHRTINYALGVLAIVSPVSVVLIIWQAWPALILLWACVAAGGLAVILSYLVDWLRQLVVRQSVSAHEAQVLRPEVDHAPRSNQG